MRVPSNNYSESLVNQLNTLRSRQYNLQSQVASGLKVNAPSDDPTAMANTLNLVTDKAAAKQYSANLGTLQDRANNIYNVLQSLQTISSQAGADAISAANDAGATTTTKTTLLADLNALLKHAVELANAKDPATGQALFGGTSGSATPFTATTDSEGNITAVAYGGNASVNQVAIGANATAAVDVPGVNATGSGTRGLFSDSRSGADFFQNLINLRDHVATGNTAAIASTDKAALEKDSDNLLYHISNNGVTQTRLNLTATGLQNNLSALDKNISGQTSADLVETMVQLNQAQNSYQAALQSGAKIMQLSILNYL